MNERSVQKVCVQTTLFWIRLVFYEGWLNELLSVKISDGSIHTCDNNFSMAPVGATLALARADVDASIT